MAKDRGKGAFDFQGLEHSINRTGRKSTGMSPNPDHLSLMAREAREHGMSYGQYIAAYHPVNWEDHHDDLEPSGRGKICPCCGKRFYPTSPQKIYCSDTCRYEAYHNRKSRGEGPGSNRVRVEFTLPDGTTRRFDSMSEAESVMHIGKGRVAKALRDGSCINGMTVRRREKDDSTWPLEEDPEPLTYIPGLLDEN